MRPGRNGDLDRFDKVGLAVVGLILLGVLLRSLEDATDVRDVAGAAGGVLFLSLLLLWKAAGRWLSSRQEGVVTLLVGLATIGLVAGLAPDGTAVFDRELVAVYGLFFLYGLVQVIQPDVGFEDSLRLFGGLSLVAGTALIGLGLAGVNTVGLLGGLRTSVTGSLIAFVGLVLVLRPDADVELATDAAQNEDSD